MYSKWQWKREKNKIKISMGIVENYIRSKNLKNIRWWVWRFFVKDILPEKVITGFLYTAVVPKYNNSDKNISIRGVTDYKKHPFTHS